MSDIVAGILKIAVGFISDKFRTYGTDKLQDGGLTDQKFRGWIVRDLDDIKFKLDGLSRRDLASSLSVLRQGVERLHMCFGESTETEDPSRSKLPKKEKQLQDTTNVGASTSTQTKPSQKSVTVEDALALANVTGKLKIKSNKMFELAKESFEQARKEARLAFHNDGLSTENRLLASEVRLASGILEHLERPEVAANDCLLYLQELHDMRAIQDIFSVHVQGGIKSFFKKESRAAIVQTVTMINLMLADFISKFTKRRMAVFDWPMIECGKRVVHPIYYKQESVRNMEKMGITAPWDIVMRKGGTEAWSDEQAPVAINSRGDIIGVKDGSIRKVDRATGEVQPFCLSLSDEKTWKEGAIAIDDNDMVYVLWYNICSVPAMGCEVTAMLSVCSPDGQIIHHCPMDFIEERPQCIAVTKDKKILICLELDSECVAVYVCDSNGKQMKSFFIYLQSGDQKVKNMMVSCDKSSDNEIILATQGDYWMAIYVCTLEGQLKRVFDVPLPQSNLLYLPCGIVLDHNTKNYIIYSQEDDTYVNCVSETGEQRNLLFLDNMDYITGTDCFCTSFSLVGHANGVIAMVNSNCVLYLRSPMM